MALFRGIGARKDAVRGTSPIEVRKVLAALFSSTGVLPGGTTPLMTGTAGWAYAIGSANFVTSRSAADGTQVYGNDGSVTIGTTGVGSSVPIAPGAGLQRIDIAWTRHPSNTENADTSSEPLFGVASGVAAASNPVAPTIPAGALELGRNTMTSAATSTLSAGNTITQTTQTTNLRGVMDPAAVTQSTGTLGPGFTTDAPIITAPAVTGDGVKRFKITGKSSVTQFTAVGDIFDFRLKDGATVIAVHRMVVVSTSYAHTPILTVSHVPTAGSHTYSMSLVRVSGTGTALISPTAITGDVLEIIVEQIA